LKNIFILIIISFPITLFAQKHIEAKCITNSIKIDGNLSEKEWQNAMVASDFIQSSPIAGQKDKQKTEVKILYDNTSIYIGATMYDVSKDSISTTLSNRDDFGNADYFSLIIDTYGASTIGFAFGVSAAGVQKDQLISTSGSDGNWNAVWESHVSVKENKWIAEIQIPFSALRFSIKELHNWRINFNRGIRRYRTDSYWNEYDPKGLNLLSQLGYLDGVKGVETPVRLAFIPYASAYIVNSDNQTNYKLNGGMDLKYGINDAFTLDMTLIPDFGQVQFDQKVLNLSPFEVRYNERRQFFTEGVELFNKGGLFYSRRVGSQPIDYYNISTNSNEIIDQNPNTTPLLNATKVSGRTKKGLGIGVFNGLTRETKAIILDTLTGTKREVQTNPISNYNVLVFDQNLKHNSSVTLVNTSVWRAGKTYDANVTAFLFDLYNKKASYNLFGNANVSQKYTENGNQYGLRSDISLDKSSGNFLFGIDYAMADDKYDPNDLGYLRRNNFSNYTVDFFYNTYKPFWRIYKTWSRIDITHIRLFNPNVYESAFIKGRTGAMFKNYLAAGINASYNLETHDYFEARIPGRKFIIPPYLTGGFFISSNYANRFAYDISANITSYQSNRSAFNLTISPRFRFSAKLSVIYTTSLYQSYNEKGLALTSNYQSVLWNDNNPIFGQRNRQNIENSIQANYIFTNRMGISFILRHYWAKVEYSKFFKLNQDGTLSNIQYTGLNDDLSSIHNNNYNAFTIDMAYRWVFKRGSQLSLVWKNSVFNSNNLVDYNYFKNVEQLGNQAFTNSLSLKVLYYIDYIKVKNKIFKSM
jgi:hypothetical protein